MSPAAQKPEAVYRLVRAPEGYLTVEPRPTAEELEAFYRHLYFQETVSTQYQPSYSADDLALLALQHRLALVAAEQALGEAAGPKTLLDVGCGEGFMLAAAAARDYDVHGVDYSAFGIERHNPAMRSRFQQGDVLALLDQLIAGQHRFRIVNLSGILEHVLDPAALIGKAKAVLEPSGVIRVLVPNDDSKMQRLARTLGKIEQPWFCPPQHLHYFNTDTLPRFLAAHGLRTVKLLGDFPIDVFLLNDWSNYAADPGRGKEAHLARQHMQRLLSEAGDEACVQLQEAQARCGIGRDLAAYAVIQGA
jgi:2-polyprenyl-3-methyl-5-hydroxy-6-metoxy-1,4-benzoquinol methylase